MIKPIVTAFLACLVPLMVSCCSSPVPSHSLGVAEDPALTREERLIAADKINEAERRQLVATLLKRVFADMVERNEPAELLWDDLYIIGEFGDESVAQQLLALYLKLGDNFATDIHTTAAIIYNRLKTHAVEVTMDMAVFPTYREVAAASLTEYQCQQLRPQLLARMPSEWVSGLAGNDLAVLNIIGDEETVKALEGMYNLSESDGPVWMQGGLHAMLIQTVEDMRRRLGEEPKQ